jgi:hypothetical protein
MNEKKKKFYEALKTFVMEVYLAEQEGQEWGEELIEAIADLQNELDKIEAPKSDPPFGYYHVQPAQPNIFLTASLADIVQQLESCGYRCEAGPLELNIAFIELKRRAEAEAEREKRFPGRLERALLIAVRQAAQACLDYIYEFEQVPDGKLQDALHDALQRILIPLEEVDQAYKIIEAHGLAMSKAREADV